MWALVRSDQTGWEPGRDLGVQEVARRPEASTGMSVGRMRPRTAPPTDCGLRPPRLVPRA